MAEPVTALIGIFSLITGLVLGDADFKGRLAEAQSTVQKLEEEVRQISGQKSAQEREVAELQKFNLMLRESGDALARDNQMLSRLLSEAIIKREKEMDLALAANQDKQIAQKERDALLRELEILWDKFEARGERLKERDILVRRGLETAKKYLALEKKYRSLLAENRELKARVKWLEAKVKYIDGNASRLMQELSRKQSELEAAQKEVNSLKRWNFLMGLGLLLEFIIILFLGAYIITKYRRVRTP